MRRRAIARRVAGLLGLAWLLLAGPLLAYTIYLKDGSKLITREKYRVEGDKALVTLQNGAQSFIPLDQIDVEKTEAANQTDLGAAVLIEHGKKAPLTTGSTARSGTDDRRLSDLINERGLTTASPPPARRPPELQPDAVKRTATGHADLTTLGKRPYADEAVAADLVRTLAGLGFTEAQVYQGTAAHRPFVLIPAADEPAVLRALAAGAEALMKVRQSQPDQVADLELLMLSPSRERGGQFLLTPEQAADLVTKKVDPVAFFLTNVQF